MGVRTPTGRIALGLLTALLALLTWLVGAVATPVQAAGPDGGGLVASQVAGSVAYLTAAYGVTESEALRRLTLQQQVEALAEQLTRTAPTSYAGAWMDQDNGGVLVIGATDPAAVAAALAGVPDRQHIRIASARYPLRDLLATAATLRAQVARPADSVTVDEMRDQVVFRTGSPAAAVSAQRAERRPGLLSVAAPVPAGLETACALGTPQHCDPPLRGGVTVQVWNANTNTFVEICTLGFNVKGSNGWVYTATAGHCLTDHAGNETKSQDSGSTVHPVGYEVLGMTSANYPVDGTVMPFVVSDKNYAVYWQPRGWVIDGGNVQYPVRGMYTYDQIGIGWIACSTGQTSGTRCGKVIGKDGGIVMDICRRFGDSGGPLYSEVDQRAYGIENWVNTDGNTCPSGAQSHYTSLSGLFNYAWNYQHITFSVMMA